MSTPVADQSVIVTGAAFGMGFATI